MNNFLPPPREGNPCEITKGAFADLGKNLKICMVTQMTLNSQSNLKKEKQSWRNQTPCLQIILGSNCYQNS